MDFLKRLGVRVMSVRSIGGGRGGRNLFGKF